MAATYSISTIDPESGQWTVQEGLSVPSRGATWRQLLTACRELRGMGYSVDYSSVHGSSDPCVLIERETKPERQHELF